MKAVIYARYSSDNQREESIVAQLRACREYCERKKYTVVEEYADEAFSARSDDRPDFQRMIEASKSGLFDVLVCHKIDRFSRDRYDYAYYKKALGKHKVNIEFVDQKLDGSPESIILESVLVGMSEYYSKNLAREVMKGMTENAMQCLHTGGKPALGYDVVSTGTVNKKGRVKKTYAINESEAQIIRFIFSSYVDGKTYESIIKEVEERNWRSKNGSKIGKNSIYDILKNKKYVGIYTFNRVTGGRTGIRNNRADNPNMIEIPGGIPAIIDTETWEKAQEKLKGREREKGRMKAKLIYLLSGLIYCGGCGSSMTGQQSMTTHRSLGKQLYAFYRCNHAHRTISDCPVKRIKKEWAEKAVVMAIKNSLFTDKAIRELTKTINAASKQASKSHDEEMKALQKEKAALRKKQDNLYTLAEGGEIDEFLRERLNNNKKRLTEIDYRMEQIEKEAARSNLSEEHFAAVMYSWRDATEPEQLKKMLQTFVDRIEYSNDGLTIWPKLKIAANNYSGDDFKIFISTSEIRKMVFDVGYSFE